MRIRIVRALLVTCALFVVLDVISCRIFDEIMLPVEALGLARDSIGTPSGWEVSFLRAVASEENLQRLIYVHGTPGDATAFERYLVDPLRGFESISIDRPGFGHTSPRSPALTLREQALAIEPFLVEQGGKWPVLVGHSFGGPVIARAAADYPDRVGGLVILAGSMDPSLEKIAWYQRLGNFAFIPYMIPRWLRNANRELYPLKEELEKLRPLLANVTCPVIIVHAPDDFLVPFGNVAYMEAHFSSDAIRDVHVLEGKNHFIPWNAEENVRQAISQIAAL